MPRVSAAQAAVRALSAFKTVRPNAFWCKSTFFFAFTYSSISLCTSRWFGDRFVMTATFGLRRMEISWKLESSTTATSSGFTSRISGRSGRPMLPPRCTVLPAAFSISAMTDVVVVLPSLPVTA